MFTFCHRNIAQTLFRIITKTRVVMDKKRHTKTVSALDPLGHYFQLNTRIFAFLLSRYLVSLVCRRTDFGNFDLAANLTSIIDEYWQLGKLQTDDQLLEVIDKLGREMREDVPTYTASPNLADIHFIVEGGNGVPTLAYTGREAHHVDADPAHTKAPPEYSPRETDTFHVDASAPPAYTREASPNPTQPSPETPAIHIHKQKTPNGRMEKPITVDSKTLISTSIECSAFNAFQLMANSTCISVIDRRVKLPMILFYFIQ